MHPFLHSLHRIKRHLYNVYGASGHVIDVFAVPSDMETYAGLHAKEVKCIVQCPPNEVERMRQQAPTRPKVHVIPCALHTEAGRQCFRAFCAGSARASFVWLNLHKCSWSYDTMSLVFRMMRNLLREAATVVVICVNVALARQLSKSNQVVIDDNGNILLRYELRQPMEVCDIEDVQRALIDAGYACVRVVSGDAALHSAGINMEPHDRWTSQVFTVLHYQTRCNLFETAMNAFS